MGGDIVLLIHCLLLQQLTVISVALGIADIAADLSLFWLIAYRQDVTTCTLQSK